MIEIERKFLVNGTDFTKEAFKYSRISQGYLCKDPKRTVRVRIKENQGYITIKGEGDITGTSRFEWEKEIPLEEAKELLDLCLDFVIDKTRYFIQTGVHIFEVDVFHGANQGLIIAEIELSRIDETFTKPYWLGQEVTGELKYYNSHIASVPFCNW